LKTLFFTMLNYKIISFAGIQTHIWCDWRLRQLWVDSSWSHCTLREVNIIYYRKLTVSRAKSFFISLYLILVSSYWIVVGKNSFLKIREIAIKSRYVQLFTFYTCLQALPHCSTNLKKLKINDWKCELKVFYLYIFKLKLPELEHWAFGSKYLLFF
jgi:hypothetical protein